MIPFASVSDWNIIGSAAALVSAAVAIWTQKRSAYQDLEDRIRRPLAWSLRHPVQAFKRRSR